MSTKNIMMNKFSIIIFLLLLALATKGQNKVFNLKETKLLMQKHPYLSIFVGQGGYIFDEAYFSKDYEKMYPDVVKQARAESHNFEYFSYSGINFMYSGDLVGAILCILSSSDCITDHIVFLNPPIYRKSVYFFYNGGDVLDKDSSICNSCVVDGQTIILNRLKKIYNFEVMTDYDTLSYLYLSIINRDSLEKHLLKREVTLEEMDKMRGEGDRRTFVNFRLKIFEKYIAYCANVRLEENPEINDSFPESYYFYNFDFPLDMFDAPLIWSKFDKINEFLASKGLKLEHRRKLAKIYKIRFRYP